MTLIQFIAAIQKDHEFHIGDHVWSKALGRGKVVALVGVANLRVQFADGEPRLMRASYLSAVGVRVNPAAAYYSSPISSSNGSALGLHRRLAVDALAGTPRSNGLNEATASISLRATCTRAPSGNFLLTTDLSQAPHVSAQTSAL
jgi:hypothetical protein